MKGRLLETASEGIIVVGEGGRILQVNGAVERLFSCSRRRVLGGPVEALLPRWPEESLTLLDLPHSAALDAEFQGMHEVIGLRSGKVIFPIWITAVKLAYGGRNLIVLRVRDLMRQKVLLEDNQRIIGELSRSRTNLAQLAAIVESSQDAIIGMTLGGAVATWNSGAANLFSVSLDDAIGKTLGRLVAPPDRQAEFEEVVAHCVENEKGGAYELSRPSPSGSTVHILISLSPLRDIEGRLVGASAIARDITQRVEMENELARHRDHLESVVADRTDALLRSQEKVRSSERLASIGALAAGIAHEINNPIGAIALSAQNALTLAPEQTSVEDLKALVLRVCTKILNNSRRCGLIVKGILQFARKHNSRKWANDINVIATSSVQLLRDSMDLGKVEILCDLEQGLAQPEINPTEIEQVFLNLLKNSVDALGGSGKVVVKTSSSMGHVVIEVSDNGLGIPGDQLQYVFDPFYTTRQNEGGTGLGLSIVHGIVTDHCGSITVESARESGTKFTVELPLAQPPAAPGLTQKSHDSMAL